MSSRFAPTRPRINLPVVCIKPRANLPQPYVAGVPNALHVTAWWRDPAIPAWLAESFPLYATFAPPGWSGQSAQVGLNLHVDVLIMPAENTYDIFLTIRRDLTYLDDDSWHGVIIAPGPPFNSGLLQHVYISPTDTNGIRVLD